MAALYKASQNSPSLLQLIEQRVNRDAIDFFVDTVGQLVDSAIERRPPSHRDCVALVSDLVNFSHMQMSVILTALSYLERAKSYLNFSSSNVQVCESICLGAIMVAHRYASDSPIARIQWWICSGGTFDDVSKIDCAEDTFATALQGNFEVSEEDLQVHYPAFSRFFPNLLYVRPYPSPPPSPTISTYSVTSAVSSEPILTPTMSVCHFDSVQIRGLSRPSSFFYESTLVDAEEWIEDDEEETSLGIRDDYETDDEEGCSGSLFSYSGRDDISIYPHETVRLVRGSSALPITFPSSPRSTSPTQLSSSVTTTSRENGFGFTIRGVVDTLRRLRLFHGNRNHFSGVDEWDDPDNMLL